MQLQGHKTTGALIQDLLFSRGWGVGLLVELMFNGSAGDVQKNLRRGVVHHENSWQGEKLFFTDEIIYSCCSLPAQPF
jgi:hypothetical protein